MKQRCLNKNHEKYDSYGGNGIKIDPSWMTFETFLYDMGPRPFGKTLDRINPYGDYKPDNCKWSTAKQQGKNKR